MKTYMIRFPVNVVSATGSMEMRDVCVNVTAEDESAAAADFAEVLQETARKHKAALNPRRPPATPPKAAHPSWREGEPIPSLRDVVEAFRKKWLRW